MFNIRRIALVVLALVLTSVHADAQDWVTKESQWKTFRRLHFKIDGKEAWVTVPKKALPGNPWIWRARFPGSPRAIQRADRFYKFATEKIGLAKTVALEGVSRGGLLVYNWAAKHPGRVACIYCDTPVCDFKSWPGGQGTGIGHGPSWKQCAAAYELDEEAMLAYRKNPVDHAAVFAKAKIPLMTIVSMNDRVVPPSENTFVLQERLNALGHRIEIIRVPEGTQKSNGHHFAHPDPERVVAFIRKHAQRGLAK
jgi:sialidase-1